MTGRVDYRVVRRYLVGRHLYAVFVFFGYGGRRRAWCVRMAQMVYVDMDVRRL